MKNMNPLTLVLSCLLSTLVLHWIFPMAMVSSWLLLALGVALIVLGLAMSFGAEGQFRKRGTTVDHIGRATALVTDGWYKYSRNPMYLSFLLMLIGAWLSLGSISAVVLIPIYIFLGEQWFILPEEKRLAATFGKEYVSYQRHTRRWL